MSRGNGAQWAVPGKQCHYFRLFLRSSLLGARKTTKQARIFRLPGTLKSLEKSRRGAKGGKPQKVPRSTFLEAKGLLRSSLFP